MTYMTSVLEELRFRLVVAGMECEIALHAKKSGMTASTF
jgi:hypothetical protein